jgi:hypothetical protein
MDPFFLSRFSMPEENGGRSSLRSANATVPVRKRPVTDRFLANRGLQKTDWIEVIKMGTTVEEPLAKARRTSLGEATQPAPAPFVPAPARRTSLTDVKDRGTTATSLSSSTDVSSAPTSPLRADAIAPAVPASPARSVRPSGSSEWKEFREDVVLKLIAPHLDAVVELRRYKDELAQQGFVSPPKCFFDECKHLEAVDRLKILDTPPEKLYSNIAAVRVALVGFFLLTLCRCVVGAGGRRAVQRADRACLVRRPETRLVQGEHRPEQQHGISVDVVLSLGSLSRPATRRAFRGIECIYILF